MNDPLASLWVEKYRPTTLEDIVLSKEDREFFESLKTKKEIPHLLFAGIQGTGKTSLSKIIINDILKCEYLYINASDECGIDTIRSKVIGFARTKSFDGKIKIVLLDESDSISFEAMKALRNTIEEFSATCRFILTCNYLHKVIAPIQSRCQIITLNPPIEITVARVIEILKKENISIPEDQKTLLLNHIRKHLPDIRRIVNDVQKYSVNGVLNMKTDIASEFVEKIFKKLCNKLDIVNIRKDIIKNGRLFSNDYHSLLKQMFDVIFESDLDADRKIAALLVISKGMELDALMIDKEINCFTTFLKLAQTIN